MCIHAPTSTAILKYPRWVLYAIQRSKTAPIIGIVLLFLEKFTVPANHALRLPVALVMLKLSHFLSYFVRVKRWIVLHVIT
jgi:hypothetical protein